MIIFRLPALLLLWFTLFGLVSAAAPQQASPAHFAGDSACATCHQQEAATYQHTSHHLASQLPSASSILGSFEPGKSTLIIAQPVTVGEPRLSFHMERRRDGFYQTALAEVADQRLTRTEPIDLVFGNGTRGQTYLFWKANNLFELPVSFWSEGQQWINSPGYHDGTANFARHVNARCLECHATYIKSLSNDLQSNTFDRTSLIAGISCETCHGPGTTHITAQGSAQLQAILNPAHLPRDRQIDQCALCHNGAARAELAPAFSYKPGEDLARYLAPSTLDEGDSPDVHGNQVGLLERSACFRSSREMSCATCHNVHAPERPANDYSANCLQCHKTQSCPESKHLGVSIAQQCVSCHMPLIQTDAIVSVTGGRTTRTSIRTHWIKVYPAANQSTSRVN